MQSVVKHPKNSAIPFLLFTVLLSVVLYYGRELLVPLVYAAFFAMLMAPVCRKLEDKKVNRVIAVIVCVFILLVALLGIFAVLVGEITSFIDDLPAIQKKILEALTNLESFIEHKFDMPPTRQVALIKQQINSAGASTGSYFGRVIGGVTGTLGGLVLTVIYTFLFLFHKEKYETFFIKLFSDGDPKTVKQIIGDVTTVGQKYLSGRAIAVFLLWIIYTIALLLYGIKSAFLLAAIAALLSIIPYIGSVLGSIFPFFMAVVTKDFTTALWVAVVLLVLHALSTYFIEPIVIGRKVKLSALAMLVGIIAGGFVWGISGMILFIPIFAMAKIVFEHIDNLKPYAYLIADPEEGSPSKLENWIYKKFKKKSKLKTRADS
jgi:predicted PurR-regulated permease PerM